jgi:hypothetical protein
VSSSATQLVWRSLNKVFIPHATHPLEPPYVTVEEQRFHIHLLTVYTCNIPLFAPPKVAMLFWPVPGSLDKKAEEDATFYLIKDEILFLCFV